MRDAGREFSLGRQLAARLQYVRRHRPEPPVDNDTFRLTARLKIAAARAGLAIDVLRFVGDAGYARAMLGRFADGADEEGVVLALQLLDRLGLAAAANGQGVVPISSAQPQPALQEVRAEPAREERRKSVGALRG